MQHSVRVGVRLGDDGEQCAFGGSGPAHSTHPPLAIFCLVSPPPTADERTCFAEQVSEPTGFSV